MTVAEDYGLTEQFSLSLSSPSKIWFYRSSFNLQLPLEWLTLVTKNFKLKKMELTEILIIAKKWAKIPLAIYCCVICSVPSMPSYYTFSINTLGFLASCTATGVLIRDLNKSQNTLSNRIFLLFLLASLLALLRTYFLSVPSCWFNAELTAFLETHQTLCMSLFPFRNITILLTIFVCFLSGSRLLLFASPARFHNANPPKWMALSGGVCITILILDHVYSALHCGMYKNNFKGSDMVFYKILIEEFGLQSNNRSTNSSLLEEFDLQSKNRSTNSSQLMENSQEEKELCQTFPTVAILIGIALHLEIIKIMMAVVQEISKKRRLKKICPTTNSRLKRLPKPAVIPLEDHAIRRDGHGSCPSVIEAGLIETEETTNFSRRQSLQLPPGAWAKSSVFKNQEKKVEICNFLVKEYDQFCNVFTMLYKRAGTIVYVFMVLGLVLVYAFIFSSADNLGIVVNINIILVRLFVYCVSVFLFVFL